jgi:hypothetical protein
VYLAQHGTTTKIIAMKMIEKTFLEKVPNIFLFLGTQTTPSLY